MINFLLGLYDKYNLINIDRFKRWTGFLGRKMFLCLISMLLLTFSFIGITLLALCFGSAELMKALGSELWTGYCVALGGLFGAGVTSNVFEHKEKTKREISSNSSPPPADTK